MLNNRGFFYLKTWIFLIVKILILGSQFITCNKLRAGLINLYILVLLVTSLDINHFNSTILPRYVPSPLLQVGPLGLRMHSGFQIELLYFCLVI